MNTKKASTRNRVDVMAIAPVVCSLLLAVGVSTIFRTCGLKDDGTWMRCHYPQIYVAICAACMAALQLAAAFSHGKALKVALYVVSGVGAVVSFLLVGTIMPLCKTMNMRCYTHTQPFVRLMAVVILALCAIAIARVLRERAK